MNFKDNLKIFFYDRAPNTLIFEHIKYAFPHLEAKSLEKSLQELIAEGFLETQVYSNERYPNFKRTGYRIAPNRLGSYPIKTEIEIGDIKIPRMLDTDTVRAEDINSICLSFDKIITEKTKQLKKSFDSELRKYWGTVITLFGLFLTIFSLVNVAIKPIYYSSDFNLSPKEIFIQSTYNIIPLAIVLFLFLIILYSLFKSK